MVSHYATAFKTGKFPAVSKDQIVMWSRPHPALATATNDPVGPPANHQIVSTFYHGHMSGWPETHFLDLQTEDKIWAVVFATSPATLTLSTSSKKSKTFKVPAGGSEHSLPIAAGETMKAVLKRNGNTVIDLHPKGFTFSAKPSTYNYNAFVVSS